jgi:hypothetical protein
MVSILLWSILFGPFDSRIVLLFVAPAHDVVMFPVLFSLVVFVVVSKGRLANHNAQWSLDISAVVKHCVHLSRLVCSGVH